MLYIWTKNDGKKVEIIPKNVKEKKKKIKIKWKKRLNDGKKIIEKKLMLSSDWICLMADLNTHILAFIYSVSVIKNRA